MNVFLDDVRDTPNGWTRCYWPDEVIALLQKKRVDTLSLDHDLGDDARGTGMTVINWIEEQVYANEKFMPPFINVHSDNAPRRIEMCRVIERIATQAEKNRLAQQHTEARIKAHLTTVVSSLSVGLWAFVAYYCFFMIEFDVVWPLKVVVVLIGLMLFPWVYIDMKQAVSVLRCSKAS